MDVGSTIGLGASVVGIATFVVAASRGASTTYRRTLGSRRDLRERLNQLACGVSTDYVRHLLGQPAFQRQVDVGGHEHTFRMRHAWVVTRSGADGAVQAFSVTVTDPKFAFDLAHLSWGLLHVVLGRSTFAALEANFIDGRRLSIRARRYEYAEACWFGNPGGYQRYVASHNDAGRGNWNSQPLLEAHLMAFADGSLSLPDPYDAGAGDPAGAQGPLGVLRSTTTINTMTVLGPEASSDVFGAWYPIGVDRDRVRLLH